MINVEKYVFLEMSLYVVIFAKVVSNFQVNLSKVAHLAVVI